MLFFLLAWNIVALSNLSEIPIKNFRNVSFKTGDIVLLRLRSYEQYPIASTIVSHMAVVWIVDGQAMIVDMNPTPNGPYKEIENVFARGDSVVIYPLSFAVLNYPGSIFLRSLRKELSAEQELKFSESIKFTNKKLIDGEKHFVLGEEKILKIIDKKVKNPNIPVKSELLGMTEIFELTTPLNLMIVFEVKS